MGGGGGGGRGEGGGGGHVEFENCDIRCVSKVVQRVMGGEGNRGIEEEMRGDERRREKVRHERGRRGGGEEKRGISC